MILITGGTGLVGSHLAYDLLNKGYEIKILVRESSDRNQIQRVFRYYDKMNAAILYSKINWVVGDLTDRFSLDEALDDVDIVFHIAAMISYRKRDAGKIKSVNIKGTADLVDRCLARTIKKFCFVSSVAALGVPVKEQMIDESTFLKPEKGTGIYEFSKFGSEMEVWRGIQEGLNAVIINPSLILGPGYWNLGSNSLFTYLAKGSDFFIEGITGFVDVRDVTHLMIQLIERDILAERFIISSENISFIDFASLIAKEFNNPAPKFHISQKIVTWYWRFRALISPVSSLNYIFSKNVVKAGYKKDIFSNEKIKKCLNFEFRPISETIRDLSQFYKQDLKSDC